MRFNHDLINIMFKMLQKLDRIISMNILSDHLRPKEQHKVYFYFTVEIKSFNILYKNYLYVRISYVPPIVI